MIGRRSIGVLLTSGLVGVVLWWGGGITGAGRPAAAAAPHTVDPPPPSPPPPPPLPKCGGQGEGHCRHASPFLDTIVTPEADITNPFKDVCSWWGDVDPFTGGLPPHRLRSTGAVPPRSMCYVDWLCISDRKLCSGVVLDRPLQFCPHHDGPLRLVLSPCPPQTCEKATISDTPTYLIATSKWLMDGGNVWHWMTSLLDVFGMIVESSPSLLPPVPSPDGPLATPLGVYNPTPSQLVVVGHHNGYWKDDTVSSMAGKYDPTRRDELTAALQSLASPPILFPDPASPTPQCYPRVWTGTATETFLQWESRTPNPRQQRTAAAFAAHFMRVAMGRPDAPLVDSPNKDVASPWDRLHDKGRAKPRLVLVKRGEGKRAEKRQMVSGSNPDPLARGTAGASAVIAAARKVGFEVVELDAGPRDSLFTQALTVAGADVLMGVHGAALGWGMVLPPHGVLVELRPSRALVDRTFIYPTLSAARGLGYLEWPQTEPVVPSATQRLPLDTHHNITQSAAEYHLAVAMRTLLSRAPWFDTPHLWHPR